MIKSINPIRCSIDLFGQITLITPQAYIEDADLQAEDRDSRRPAIAKIYQLYCERCFKSGAMDFDDLLLNMYIILEKFPDALYKYQHKFRYVLIDEFQDTNTLRCLS